MWQKDTRARDKPSQHAARGGRRFGPFDPWTFPPFELSMHIVSNVFVISPIFGIMHASNQRAQLRWTKQIIHFLILCATSYENIYTNAHSCVGEILNYICIILKICVFFFFAPCMRATNAHSCIGQSKSLLRLNCNRVT